MTEDTDEPPARQPSSSLLDIVIRLGFIALLLVLVYLIFAPLFPAILWGILLAIICAHPYERLVGRLRGRRQLADLVFGLILLMVLLLPAVFFAWELILNMPLIASRLQTLSASPMPDAPEWLAALPFAGPELARLWDETAQHLDTQVPVLLSHLGGMAGWAFAQIGTFGAFLFQFVLGALLSLFLLHHRFAVRAFQRQLLVRVGGDFAHTLVLDAFDATRAAFTGVIVAAIAQTLLASVAIFLAGLPVILFAGFTFLLALIQIGPMGVMIVACAILAVKGSYLAAWLVAGWFILVVMSVDNVIRPYFSSTGSSVPGILSFLGTIGGLLSWGLLGVFVGPVLTSILYDMLMEWVDPQRTGTGAPQA